MSNNPKEGDTQSCRFCQEPIIFSMPPKAFMDALFDKGVGVRPSWLHSKTLVSVCDTRATPKDD